MLGELFRCEHLVDQYPRGLTRRACLRRQVERVKVLDGAGKVVGWRPLAEYCATACQQGVDTVLALSPIRAVACPRCGGVVIGDEGCAPCGEQASLKVVQPKVKRPPQLSSVIWGGAVPDVPIGGPPATSPHRGFPLPFAVDPARYSARVAADAAAAGRKRLAEAKTRKPAKPAEEDGMPCSKCGGVGHNARGCSGAARRVEVAVVRKPVLQAAPAAATAPAPGERPPQGSAPASGLTGLSLEDLVQQRDRARALARSVDEELRRRAEAIQAALKAG